MIFKTPYQSAVTADSHAFEFSFVSLDEHIQDRYLQPPVNIQPVVYKMKHGRRLFFTSMDPAGERCLGFRLLPLLVAPMLGLFTLSEGMIKNYILEWQTVANLYDVEIRSQRLRQQRR
jgi:hypothetical protein